MPRSALPVVPLPPGFPGPVYCIADLHLGATTPQTEARLFAWAQQLIAEQAALCLLGDIFEYWVGDDALDDTRRRIGERLKALADAGVPLFFIAGNRDFLIGDGFAQQAGFTRVPDPAMLHVHGQHLLLSHGDALCTGDVAYQRFRRWVRQPWLQQLFLALPAGWRRGLAAWLRGRSRGRQSHSMQWHDADRNAVDALLAQTGATALIHGHTHRPAVHDHPGGLRYVLSDWDFEAGSRGHALRIDADGIRTVAVG